MCKAHMPLKPQQGPIFDIEGGTSNVQLEQLPSISY